MKKTILSLFIFGYTISPAFADTTDSRTFNNINVVGSATINTLKLNSINSGCINTDGMNLNSNNFSCGGSTSAAFTVPAIGSSVNIPISLSQKYSAFTPLTISNGTTSISGYTTAAVLSNSTSIPFQVNAINIGSVGNVINSGAEIVTGNINSSSSANNYLHWSLVVGNFPGAANISAISVPAVFPAYTNAYANEIQYACLTSSNSLAQQGFTVYTYANTYNGGESNPNPGTAIANVSQVAFAGGGKYIMTPVAIAPGTILGTKVTSDGGNSNCIVTLEGYAALGQ